MNLLKLLMILASFLLFTNIASAITSYGEWQNKLSSITIDEGQEVYFDYALFSMNPVISYSIKMYDSNTNLIKTFIQANSNENFISGRYYVKQTDYVKEGRYSIIIQGKDGLDDESSTILTLQVNNVNNAPILNPIGNKQINENELLQFFVTASDPDNDIVTLSALNLPGNAAFTDLGNGQGIFSWQTNFNDAGIYNVRFIASDSNLQDFEDVIITVINVNNPPTLIINAPQQNEIIFGNYNIRWTASDIDQAPATLDIKIEYSNNGIIWQVLEDLQDNNDGRFIWDTVQVADGNYVLRISARDNDNNIVNASVNFRIDNLYMPTITIIRPSENEVISGNYNILWQANDLDQVANTLDIKLEYRAKDPNFISRILSLLGFQQWITLEDMQDNNDGIFTWDTIQVANGNYGLRAIARDDNGNTATAYVSLFTINNIVILNFAPIITSTPIIIAYINQLYNYDVDAIDPNNDLLTYSLVVSPIGMNINASTGLITWLPSQVGFYNIIVRVSDSQLSTTQSFTIEVREIIPPGVKKYASHEIQISNVILSYDNNLNVFINIKNQGNKKENIKIKTTIMNNGLSKEEKIKLNVNQGIWKLTEFNLPKKNYIVKVEIISKNDRDVRYAYINQK